MRYLSQLAGYRLSEITLTETIDATELLGTFEPEDLKTLRSTLHECIESLHNKLNFVILLMKRSQESPANEQRKPIYLLEEAGFDLLKDEDFDVGEMSRWLAEVEKELQLYFDNVDATLINVVLLNAIKEKISQQLTASNRLISLIGSIESNDHQQLSKSTTMTFRWIDGQLLQSIEKGDWIILKHIHFASAAVLDRLNSLLEPNGKKAMQFFLF